MTQKQEGELHEGKALAGSATGAAVGYFTYGPSGAAAGAVLGGLTGLFAGRQGLDSL